MKKNLSPNVYIICGVFNHLKDTKSLLSCIKKQAYPNINILIIDDNSSDGTYEYIRKNYPSVNIFKGDGNLWWTGSMYLAVEEVLKTAKNEDFILTINNDCVFDKYYVNQLVNISNILRRAVVGSLVINKDNKKIISDAGVYIDWGGGKFVQLGPKEVDQLPKGMHYQDQINTLSTKGTLFPIEVFKKIGNFDKKNFPHYLSDYEFACRAKSAGFKLLLSYDAKVFNDIERTGLNNNFSDRIEFKQAPKLLFSRKSQLNIVDNYRFIKLCCPPQYKTKNYILLFEKIIKYLVISIAWLFQKK